MKVWKGVLLLAAAIQLATFASSDPTNKLHFDKFAFCDPTKFNNDHLIREPVRCDKVQWKTERKHQFEIYTPKDQNVLKNAFICTKYTQKGRAEAGVTYQNPSEVDPAKKFAPDVKDCIKWSETMKANLTINKNGNKETKEYSLTSSAYTDYNKLGRQWTTKPDVRDMLADCFKGKWPHQLNGGLNCTLQVEKAWMVLAKVWFNVHTKKARSVYDSDDLECHHDERGFFCQGKQHVYVFPSKKKDQYKKLERDFNGCHGFNNATEVDGLVYETEEDDGGSKEMGYIAVASLGLHFSEFANCGDKIKQCVKEEHGSETQVYCTTTGYVLVNKGEQLADAETNGLDSNSISYKDPQEFMVVTAVISMQTRMNEQVELLRKNLKYQECRLNRKDTVALKAVQKLNPSKVLRYFMPNSERPVHAINNGEALQDMRCAWVEATMMSSLYYGKKDRFASRPWFEAVMTDERGRKEKFDAQLTKDGYLKKGVDLFYPQNYRSVPERYYDVKGELYWFDAGGRHTGRKIKPETLPKAPEKVMKQDNTRAMTFKNVQAHLIASMASLDYSGVAQIKGLLHTIIWDQTLQDLHTKDKLDRFLKNRVTSQEDPTKITDFIDFGVFFVVCMVVCIVFTVCALGLSVLALVNRYYESRNGELTFYKKLSKNLKKMSNRNLIMKMLKIQFDTKTKRN